MNEGWVNAEERLPEGAGMEYLVSAVNTYGQRVEFIAFTGYGDYPFRWYTNDTHYMEDRFGADNRVSHNWTIKHWKELDRYMTTTLRRVSDRRKSEKYECTACGGVCYFANGRRKIWYQFCPCCGREVQYETAE